MSSPVLIFPGFGNSGPEHWQSRWERENSDFVRVAQRDWNRPVCEEWGQSLETSVQRLGPSVVVVAHSMGCLALAHWALGRAQPAPSQRGTTQAATLAMRSPIKAALLVAVPDPGGLLFPPEAMGFSPLPGGRFSFPSITVASTNDPYASLEFAQDCAASWGSRFVNVGGAGHINAESGLGSWREGYALLEQLRA